MDFVVLDTETTGLSSSSDRIVEIAAIRFRDRRIVGRKSWLIDPGTDIPAAATAVHGITGAMVEGKPSFREVYPELVRFTDGAVLLAHNAPFDVRFIRAEAARNLLAPPNNPVLDTIILARRRFPGAPGYALQSLAAHLELDPPRGRPHRALADARLTIALFTAAVAREPRIENLEELIEACGGTISFGAQDAPQIPLSEDATKSQNSSAGPD